MIPDGWDGRVEQKGDNETVETQYLAVIRVEVKGKGVSRVSRGRRRGESGAKRTGTGTYAKIKMRTMVTKIFCS